MADLLDALNDSQREAVLFNNGPQLIIAGAGAGKTRVLTYKIAYLLSQGVPAQRILALTFTNKAAREMKERIMQLVPPEMARYLHMGTFHSICARILRNEAEKIGFTHDFSIYDTADTKNIIKAINKQLSLDEKIYKPSVVLSRISTAKNGLISAEDYALHRALIDTDKALRIYRMPDIYALYQARLRAANAMDFDDLLVYFCRLLQTNPQVRQFYQSAFEYVLVDEYQDTNYVQYLLVKILAEPDNHICVVGDDAQSIYSFRGADIRNILSFQAGYSDAQLFKLERNYRSTQTIVKAANSLIHHNKDQIFKEVYSNKQQGERLQLTAYATDRDEAEGVAQEIKRILPTLHLTHDDVAILYRTNAQSRVLENEMRRYEMPYRIYGGISFYQRKEIKDAVSYFRLAANPKDNEALLRIINFPARGIGDTTLRKVSEQATLLHRSLFEVVCNPEEAQLQVNKGTAAKLQAFGQMIRRFIDDMDALDAYTFAEKVMRESGIINAASMDKTPEGIDKAQNLQELLSGIQELVEQRAQEGIHFTPIQDFLSEVSLLTDQDEHLTDTQPRVTLMTVHAAKGLEFPLVFVVGLEERLFPSQFCEKPSEIEEERRLLYVAITRAMDRCYLSYAQQRLKNGEINFSSPSRFIQDIDSSFLLRTQAPAKPANSWSARSIWNAFTRQTTPDTAVHSLDSSRMAAPLNDSSRTAALKPIGKRPATAPTQAIVCEFQPGDRLQHRVFGLGTVQRVYREFDNDKIEILFDTVGSKTLLLAYAKLQKINP